MIHELRGNFYFYDEKGVKHVFKSKDDAERAFHGTPQVKQPAAEPVVETIYAEEENFDTEENYEEYEEGF